MMSPNRAMNISRTIRYDELAARGSQKEESKYRYHRWRRSCLSTIVGVVQVQRKSKTLCTGTGSSQPKVWIQWRSCLSTIVGVGGTVQRKSTASGWVLDPARQKCGYSVIQWRNSISPSVFTNLLGSWNFCCPPNFQPRSGNPCHTSYFCEEGTVYTSCRRWKYNK
jgi:hypothetical protein